MIDNNTLVLVKEFNFVEDSDFVEDSALHIMTIDMLVDCLKRGQIETIETHIYTSNARLDKFGVLWYDELKLDANNIISELKNLESKYNGHITDQRYYIEISAIDKEIFRVCAAVIEIEDCKNIDFNEEEFKFIKENEGKTV